MLSSLFWGAPKKVSLIVGNPQIYRAHNILPSINRLPLRILSLAAFCPPTKRLEVLAVYGLRLLNCNLLREVCGYQILSVGVGLRTHDIWGFPKFAGTCFGVPHEKEFWFYIRVPLFMQLPYGDVFQLLKGFGHLEHLPRHMAKM